MKHGFLFLLFYFFSAAVSAQNVQLEEQSIKLKKNISFKLRLPKGYRISIAAEGLKRPRFFAKSPDGRLFVTDLYDKSDNNKGRILILENWNENEKRFEKITTYLDHLHNPNQIIFYANRSQQFLYVAETDKLSYYSYKAGDLQPDSKPIVVASFPAYGLNYKYGGWHLTRSLAIHDNKIYVSIGSSCNACIEKEAVRATIVEMDPQGKNQKIFATGLRNSVGIKWINNELWASCMGRDLIGPDKPEDLFQLVKENGYYGWPFYYQYHKKIYEDVSFKDSIRKDKRIKPAVAPWGFQAHAAPLGFEYLSNFADTALNNRFLVALHGSTSVWRQRGNSIVQLTGNGTYREIVTGFLQGKTENTRFGRPCDILQWDQQSFFFSDDKNGVIYFVWKTSAN